MNEPRIPGGYILLSRKIIESEIWDKPPLYLKVWIYILSKAQHKEYKSLKRGQTFISIPELIEVCSYKVGYRTEKPTKKQIFGILEWLRNPSDGTNEGNDESTMIVTTKVTHGMVVEVSNYAFYQDSKNYEGNSEIPTEEPTKEQRREQQGNNNNKNVKNDKNDKNEQEKDYTSKIKDLLPVFSSINNFNELNKKYWNVIRETRKTGQVAKSVIYNNMKKWEKYDPIVIEYALKSHVDQHVGKKEEYTVGIMRNTTRDEARVRMNLNNTIPFPKKAVGGIDWDNL